MCAEVHVPKTRIPTVVCTAHSGMQHAYRERYTLHTHQMRTGMFIECTSVKVKVNERESESKCTLFAKKNVLMNKYERFVSRVEYDGQML